MSATISHGDRNSRDALRATEPHESGPASETLRVADGDGAGGVGLGSSDVMARLQERVRQVAASSAPALIVGESGSGKDVVAHALHALGPRRARPFFAVNTAAIPEHLLESEIFGHVRGAFSGATEARRGLFIAADGGTVFLDEIGDMPIALQSKLLRVLEAGEVRAVGSDTVRTVDVRIIAATHRDLPKLVEAGGFRADLFFRLNVLPLVVPPLRERRDDIGALAVHFLAQARERMPSSPVRTISDEALLALKAAPWPGNVRELASTIERLVVFGHDEQVSLEDLTFSAAPRRPPVPAATSDLCTLSALTERHVTSVLGHTGGNKVEAAAILGVNLSTLYRWQHHETPRK